MPGFRPRRQTPSDPPAAGRYALRRPAVFGAWPTGERLARIRRSPQFVDGQFRNPVPTRQLLPGSALPMARTQFAREGRLRRMPVGRIPVHRPTAADWGEPPASGLRLTWMGHSSVLAEIDGHRVLFDPVWGERCSPFTWAGPRRLHPVPVPLGELDPVDAVVISHDHYDHLDMPTVKALIRTGTRFVVPLGIGADLELWGVPEERITELDWHESTEVGGLTLTATPAQHFCGRGLRGPQHTLWASWVVAGPANRIFHSGDTGYFPGFAEIGAEHGPFDATMIQIGAYSEFWPDVHMTPEEGARAHLDLQGGRPTGLMLPIHWGTFNLAPHPWAEPAERTMYAARTAGFPCAVPHPGRPFEPADEPMVEPWWRTVALPPVHGWPSWPARTPATEAFEVAG
ncbi:MULTISPECIES: MBL fold metallo-hydrolase [Streptomyces]|uniref:MBL fold metallo-hydrolase n=2 Tax=Streptomyces rimosus subsp. rimosus TaxID=132474 RepID=L8ETZ5_STRR1|nr:MBL fold metallo-hydrolase [Streptomyces sp. SID5471]QDA03300.1 MBL fold metallo-hydrolase [Streptomyces rimosus]QGY68210.1 MBL fold metallo-hydrolase [Streptomyces rimosus R6-500]QST84674.1 MBL fold metallo-hydrolase [Streptomyces rimosus subsp. rimosus ATCC 10970]QTL85383.1 MBL fold metallo-hydrolase [Streptomyces rimosus subsp. rimosus]